MFSAIRSIIGYTLDKEVVARQMQKADMGAVVHPVRIQALSGALSNEDYLMGPIATFVWKYVANESARVKHDEGHYGPE